MNGRQQYGSDLRAAGIRVVSRTETCARQKCELSGCITPARYHIDGKGFRCRRHTDLPK